MIVQSAPIILKQRNQPHRECLYAWYPEPVTDTTTTILPPREIYIHKGIDKDLLQTNSLINAHHNSNSHNHDLIQRYKQSLAPSERIYHPNETMDEALTTPWALHYEIQRRPATPNLPSNATDMPAREEIPRRLKSAPLVRLLPPTSVLTIPEPRFVTPLIPVPTNQVPQSPVATRPQTRASSARARLNTTFPTSNDQASDSGRQQRREIKSARQYDQTSVSNEENQKVFTQTYTDIVQSQSSPIPPSTPALEKVPPTILDRKPLRSTAEVTSIPLNPHYVHRPGVVSVRNSEKKAVVRENSASKKTNRHHHHHHRRRHHHHYQRETTNEPLLALTPLIQPIRQPVEIDGITLTYDPALTLDDPSSNLTKYFVEGRLYLIKDQCYNVLENIDPTLIEKYNQSLTLPQRPKYYQTIPIDKFQVPKPPPDVHYNASETYFYNTMPKRIHRYVVDPNFISENLNVNKMALSKRPLTANVVHSIVNDMNRQKTTGAAATPVYA